MTGSLKALWHVGTVQYFLSSPSAAPPFVVEVRDGETVQSHDEFADHWDACAYVVKILGDTAQRQSQLWH